MDLYKLLDLKWLLEPENWAQLQNSIGENSRYVVPGYRYHYRLKTFPCWLECYRCELPDGRVLATDLHFSGDHFWSMEVDSLRQEDLSAPIYGLKGKNGAVLPVRLICPDVLPVIERSDRLEGQMVCFADRLEKLQEEAIPERVAAGKGLRVELWGELEDYNRRHFSLNGRSADLWELDVRTENGCITLVARADAVSFDPHLGDGIHASGFLSMDLAVAHQELSDGTYEAAPYGWLLEDSSQERYQNGFLPEFYRNQRLLLHSLRSGDYSRLERCFSHTVILLSGDRETCYSREDFLSRLPTLLPQPVERAELQHILACPRPQNLGREAIVLQFSDHPALLLCTDVGVAGRIDNVELLEAADCRLGKDDGLHLLAMFARGLCDRGHLLRSCLAKTCTYRSEYADVFLAGAGNIIRRMEEIDGNLDDDQRYRYALVPAAGELLPHRTLPEDYSAPWCAPVWQGKEPAFVIFLRTDASRKVSHVLLSCDPGYLKRFARRSAPQPEAEEPVAPDTDCRRVRVSGRELLQYDPGETVLSLLYRLAAAFNSRDLDTLRGICSRGVCFRSSAGGGTSMNDGFYSRLAGLRREKGPLTMAYARLNDRSFSLVPMFGDYSYLSVSVEEQIEEVVLYEPAEGIRELILTEEVPEIGESMAAPRLQRVEFLPPEPGEDFVMRLYFETGEKRSFQLTAEPVDEEVRRYDGRILTAGIFAHGRLVEQLPLPAWPGYGGYRPRGQGISFLSGIHLSAAELYYKSLPIG